MVKRWTLENQRKIEPSVFKITKCFTGFAVFTASALLGGLKVFRGRWWVLIQKKITNKNNYSNKRPTSFKRLPRISAHLNV